MYKKEVIVKGIIFIVLLFFIFTNTNDAEALVLNDNTSQFSAFFNVTVNDPALGGISRNYSLYVGIVNNLPQEPTGYNVTFFIPYGMRNLSACNGNGGFRNFNLTYEACTMNVAVAVNQENVTNINITSTTSAFTRFFDTREYVIVNVTSGNSSTSSTVVLNPSGIYGYHHQFNPRPYAVNNSFNNATLKFIAWGQFRPKYEAWVPLYSWNTSNNRTVLISDTHANIIYADKPFFESPTSLEFVAYLANITIYNTTTSSDTNVKFQIKTANYDKNCQILNPLQTITYAFTDPFSSTSYNQTIAIPFFTGGVFDVYYNGIKYNTTNLTTDYGINLTFDTGEANANVILNITAPVRTGNITLAVPFTLMPSTGFATCSPISIESQNISGFDPVSNPPDIGESFNNSYIISIKNNLSNFTLTNLNIRFVQPINVTINETTSARAFNITRNLLVTWRNVSAAWTNTSGLLYSTQLMNFKDNIGGSLTNGQNFTVLFNIIDVTLNSSVFNYWNPGQNASNLTINMSSEMTFPILQEARNVSGTAGSTNSYNVSVSMSSEAPLTIPTSKLTGLGTGTNCASASACNINVTIDGKEIPAQNYTIGSITTKGSLSASTHTISVSYTVPSSSSSSSGGGGSSSSSSTGGTAEENLPVNDISESSGEVTTSLLSSGNSFKFSIEKSVNHILTVLEVNKTSAKIRIRSDPIELTLKLLEKKDVDLDKDGRNDLSVRLVDIRNGVFAKFELKKLEVKEEQVSKQKESPNITEEIKPRTEIGEEINNNRTLIIILAIIIIAIVIVWIINKRKNK